MICTSKEGAKGGGDAIAAPVKPEGDQMPKPENDRSSKPVSTRGDGESGGNKDPWEF